MLSFKESAVMSAIYSEFGEKSSILISPHDLLSVSGIKDISVKELGEIMQNLAQDGYIDFVFTEMHGEEIYCVSLLKKGKGFDREKKRRKRNLMYRLLLTVAFAVISFLIGLLLKAIF